MRWSLLIVIVGLIFCVPAQSADIYVSASVDRNEIYTDELVTYTITIEGTQDFPNVPPPSGRDFVVVSGPSQSSSIQIINGKMSASKSVQWRLAPTQAGQLVIDPVTLQIGRKRYQTESVTISVLPRKPSPKSPSTPPPGSRPQQRQAKPSKSDREIFLEAVPSRTTVYKGEEVIVSFELYYQNVRTFSRNKLPDAKGFWMEEFPAQKNPQIQHVTRDGIRYKKAVIQRLAFFPTTSGELVIDPMVIECEVIVPSRRRSVFDDFFDDPFFSDPFFSRTKVVELRSEPLTIRVRDLPSSGRPEGFSGAVGHYIIESDIDTLVTEQDQALTLNYRISGNGNINAVKLPDLQLSSSVEIFEPRIKRQVNNKGKSIRGTITYDYVLIPRSSGRLHIPDLRFDYFDPRKGRYETVTARGYSVTIKPQEDYDYARNIGLRKEEIALLGSDIRFIMREEPRWSPIGRTVFSRVWFWMLNLLAIAVLLGGAYYRWWIDKLAANSEYARRRRALPRAQNSLKNLERELADGAARNYYTNLDRIVTGFIADKLALPRAGVGVREIITQLKKRNVEEATVREVENLLHTLAELRFLPDGDRPTEDLSLLERCKKIIQQLNEQL